MSRLQTQTATATHPAVNLGISDSGACARISKIEGYLGQLASALAGLDEGLIQTPIRSGQSGLRWLAALGAATNGTSPAPHCTKGA